MKFKPKKPSKARYFRVRLLVESTENMYLKDNATIYVNSAFGQYVNERSLLAESVEIISQNYRSPITLTIDSILEISFKDFYELNKICTKVNYAVNEEN
jgi:hypothetical protein